MPTKKELLVELIGLVWEWLVFFIEPTNKKLVGTERLRTYYGGKKNRGVKPEHQYKASGK